MMHGLVDSSLGDVIDTPMTIDRPRRMIVKCFHTKPVKLLAEK